MALLTDKTAKTTTPAGTDLLHVVDVSDTTQNPAGSTFKMTVDNFLKGRAFITIQSCYALKGSGNESTTALEAGDLAIYESAAELIVAVITATITTVPDDLRDAAKARRFIDNSPLL